MIKDQLEQAVADALSDCRASGALPLAPGADLPAVALESPRDSAQHGDYGTNVALRLAKMLRWPPREVAEVIAETLRGRPGGPPLGASVEVAGAGFLNFRLTMSALGEALARIVREDAGWGRSDAGAGRRVLFEFVSANPNAPLSVSHGRGGALGDALAALFESCGHAVRREFYVNDVAGARPLRAFAHAVHVRYQRLALGYELQPEPKEDAADDSGDDGGEGGEYVADIARAILDQDGDRYARLPEADALETIELRAAGMMAARQRATLEAFGVRFDAWYPESTLHQAGAVAELLDALRAAGHVKEDINGALWLRSTAFGDEQDRVLVRTDGATTYLATDLAYHQNKFARGFDQLVNVWQADHAGYVARTWAGLRALGHDPERLRVVVYQPVRLLKDGQEARASWSASRFAPLDELLDEVGRDAARLFFLLRSSDTPLDFDVDRARRQDAHNPLYSIQSAHVRCCRLLAQCRDLGLSDPAGLSADLSRLTHPDEATLIKKLAELPEAVCEAARACAPYHFVAYIQDLAARFHAYYQAGRRDATRRIVLARDPALSHARLTLVLGVRIVLRNALTLLGISAPEPMRPQPTEPTTAVASAEEKDEEEEEHNQRDNAV